MKKAVLPPIKREHGSVGPDMGEASSPRSAGVLVARVLVVFRQRIVDVNLPLRNGEKTRGQTASTAKIPYLIGTPDRRIYRTVRSTTCIVHLDVSFSSAVEFRLGS